jgi:hypothetical protein
MLLSAIVLGMLGGCAIDWKVPEQPALDAGPGSGGGGAAGGAGAQSASSSSSASGAGGSLPCDEHPTCSECVSCGVLPGCSVPFQACMADPDCWAIAQCAFGCLQTDPTSPCKDACVTGHRAGEAQFDPLLECVACNVCVMTCDEIEAWACPT